MSNVKFYWHNLLDSSASYYVSSENSQYPISNLLDPRTTKEVRGQEGVSSIDIIVDLGQAQDVDSIIFTPNAVDGWGFDSVQAFGNSSSDFTSPDFTGSTLTVDHNWSFLKTEFTTESHRYWKFTFNGGSDYVGVSNIYLGEYTQLADNNFNYGWNYSDSDLSDVDTNRWGTRFIDKRNRQKVISAEFEVLNKSEFDTIIEMYDKLGVYRPFWMIVDDSEMIVNDKERFAGYFYFSRLNSTSNRAFGLYDLSLNFVEVI